MMVRVTRRDGTRFVLNADRIEWIDAAPDTVITLVGGEKLLVAEPVEVLVRRIHALRRALSRPRRRRPASSEVSA